MKKVRNIVFLVTDISTIGGIQQRTLNTIINSTQRRCNYFIVSAKNTKKNNFDSRVFVYEKKDKDLDNFFKEFSTDDTVIVYPNNVLKSFDILARNKFQAFANIFYASGQLTFFIQDTATFIDRDYLESLKVSNSIMLSKADQSMYRQFGMMNNVVGFNPITLQLENMYNVKKNKHITYCGRIDYKTKGCDRLIEIVKVIKKNGLKPLKIFTTPNLKNSPDYDRFCNRINIEKLNEYVEFNLDVVDNKKIYNEASILVLPSRKESFGNVILEANSYGVPVLSYAYAPGPSELIDHEVTGFLVDNFLEKNLSALFKNIDQKKLLKMSKEAYKKHKDFSYERFYDFIEKISNETLDKYSGTNEFNVFPKFKYYPPNVLFYKLPIFKLFIRYISHEDILFLVSQLKTRKINFFIFLFKFTMVTLNLVVKYIKNKIY